MDLFNDLENNTSADRATTLADRETHLVFDSNWADKLNNHLDGVTWLNHGDISWQCYFTSNIRRTDVELRFVTRDEWLVAAAFSAV